MLDRLRKHFGSLLGSKDTSVIEEELQNALNEELLDRVDAAPEGHAEADAGVVARREAQKRESRLILSEQIHNRASVLLGESRTDLLHEIHRRLQDSVASPALHDLLQVTMDTGFTTRLDAFIEELLERLRAKLIAELDEEVPTGLLPDRALFAEDLKAYRDEVLRKHVLEQVEVLALPTSTGAFPEDNDPTALKESLALYWSSCRESIDKFFHSVEMVLLDSAREGIRLDSRLIRNRLVAAQYRNGYRHLHERFLDFHAELTRLQTTTELTDEKRDRLDRRFVDEIIVPLAYFIRERSEPEPRDALETRAELCAEIIEKLVIGEPLPSTAEAIKPVLRKSVEQARPLAVDAFPYLRTNLEALNPTAIHRTTALLRVFQALVQTEMNEKSLSEVETIIRLDRSQYRLHQELEVMEGRLAERLSPLDRVADDDADFVADLVEKGHSPMELVEDLFLALGYTPWPEPLPNDPSSLWRLVAVLALFPSELGTLRSLYSTGRPSAEERSRLGKALLERLTPTAVGAELPPDSIDAVPIPIDLGKALASMGYRREDGRRLETFMNEVEKALESGARDDLEEVVRLIRKLRATVDSERVDLGATRLDAEPYRVEIRLSSEGSLVGLVRLAREGFGHQPLEALSRPSKDESRKTTESKIRHHLQSQATIYQSFYNLFALRKLLDKDKRRSLPRFVKRLHEPVGTNRLQLLARLRYAREILTLIDSFAKLIVQTEPEAQPQAKSVLRILGGLVGKVAELSRAVQSTRDTVELERLRLEYERAVLYLNRIVVHGINPWLEYQTRDVGCEFEFNKDEVGGALRHHVERQGLNWDRDVCGFEAHPVRGTLGCRALLELSDGTSKAVLLNYDRSRQEWVVRHMGPRLTDVVREALRENGRELPDEYDEKFEQPTFSLDEQSCRFLLVKRGVTRVEATLVLTSDDRDPWRVVYLKDNDDVLVDRLRP
ncbi:MAG TPA: hypothetical protein VLK65_21130 [Vicinamibacteria bacterium]|nr:hypothetical protein [Vicinamibacteria bacterium]